MIDRIRQWRSNRVLAHAAPLFAFLGVAMLVGVFKVNQDWKPWYLHHPEQWVYPLQCLVAGLLLWWFWKHFRFSPFRGFGFATWMALAGIAVWIAPTALFDHWGMEEQSPGKWFGFLDRVDGFDAAGAFGTGTGPYWIAIALRFFRMVVIVPFIEEIFWRGFLMRYLADQDRDFWKVPFGTHTWMSYGVTTALFTLAHHPSDYAAAIIYGSLAYVVAVRTKSLAACVWMHAVANLVLGLYVLKSGNLGLW